MADYPSQDERPSSGATPAGPVVDQGATEPVVAEDATVALPEDREPTVVVPGDDDATTALPPGDDATTALPVGGDATRALPPGDDATRALPDGDDATRALPPGDDATIAVPRAGADPTVALPPTGPRTRPLPPVTRRTVALPSGADIARWSGRSVPPPPVDAVPEDPPVVADGPRMRTGSPGGTDVEGRGGAGSPVVPLLTGLAALTLLAVLAFGVWLIYRAMGHGGSSTAASPSVPAVTTPEPTPSSEPPSQQPVSQTVPTSDAPAGVRIPPVLGASEQEATAALNAVGLQVTVRQKDDTTAAPGTVTGVDPAEGTLAAPGSTVTLTVARRPVASVSPSRTRRPVSPSPSVGGAGPHRADQRLAIPAG